LSRSINQDVADKDRLSRFYYLVEQRSYCACAPSARRFGASRARNLRCSSRLHPKSHHGVYFRCVPCALPRWKGL